MPRDVWARVPRGRPAGKERSHGDASGPAAWGQRRCPSGQGLLGAPVPLPLLGDVEHHDHPMAVLVHVQELSVQGHLGLRLGTGGARHEVAWRVTPQVGTRSPWKSPTRTSAVCRDCSCFHFGRHTQTKTVWRGWGRSERDRCGLWGPSAPRRLAAVSSTSHQQHPQGRAFCPQESVGQLHRGQVSAESPLDTLPRAAAVQGQQLQPNRPGAHSAFPL